MSRRRLRHLSLLASLCGLLLAGCVEDYPPVNLGDAGSARVVVLLPRSMSADGITRVTATALNENEQRSTELTSAGAQWQGRLWGLGTGMERRFRAEALDAAGTPLHEMQLFATLEPRSEALIILVAPEPVAQEPDGNTPPSFNGVASTAHRVAPGGTLFLRSSARDPDPSERLSHAWEATGGSFEDANAEWTRWTAPEAEGLQTLRVVVRDTRGATVSLEFAVEVGRGWAPDTLTAVFHNRWPRLSNLQVQPEGDLPLGQPVTLNVAGADADGDPLRYQWAASCTGDFEGGDASSARFTPRVLPESSTCDNCVLVVTVQDGKGGNHTLTQPVCVRDNQPPTLLATTPSAPVATPGDLLELSVTAMDPLGRPLSFTWEASTGVLEQPARAGSTSTARWTVLSCVPKDVPARVAVTVTNSVGLSTRHAFEVAWRGPVCGHPPCAMQLAGNTLTQESDCTTDTPVFIPPSLTLNGRGHVLTAVDPAGGHFTGGILRNRGPEAHVRGLTVRAQGLLKDGPCDGGEDRLRGIQLVGASGSVVDSEVTNIRRNQPSEGSPEGQPRGCQEGYGIEVRNQGTSESHRVELSRNRITGYQKAGVLVIGAVDAMVTGNTVTGAGVVGHISQTGIQLSDGATGYVAGNEVSGHSYTGNDVASGILVAGGPLYGLAYCRDALIEGNTLTANDIGIYLSQAEADYSGPATPTRLTVVDNTLHQDAVTNGYTYQAAISDFGGGNTISGNVISGAGYDRATRPGATFDVDVTAGAASQVVFLSGPEQVAVGACVKVVVQSQDAQGNLARPTPPTFTLSASGETAPSVTFHADPECAGPVLSTVELGTSQAEAGFYFKARQPGAAKLEVSNGSVRGERSLAIQGP